MNFRMSNPGPNPEAVGVRVSKGRLAYKSQAKAKSTNKATNEVSGWMDELALSGVMK